jgi:hypothetical protein
MRAYIYIMHYHMYIYYIMSYDVICIIMYYHVYIYSICNVMCCTSSHHNCCSCTLSVRSASAASPSKPQLPFAKSVKRGAQGGENLGMASSPRDYGERCEVLRTTDRLLFYTVFMLFSL